MPPRDQVILIHPTKAPHLQGKFKNNSEKSKPGLQRLSRACGAWEAWGLIELLAPHTGHRPQLREGSWLAELAASSRVGRKGGFYNQTWGARWRRQSQTIPHQFGIMINRMAIYSKGKKTYRLPSQTTASLSEQERSLGAGSGAESQRERVEHSRCFFKDRER